MEAGKRVGLAIPLALAAPALFVSLGVAPLQRAEVYFLDAARAMAEGAGWGVPLFRGEPFFDKPPLLYWLFAGAFAALGPERWAARLVSVTAALLAIVLTRALGRRLFDAATGDAAALVLATTPGFLAMGRLAMADMALTALCLGAAALAARAAPEAGVARTAPLLASGAVLGLAFLAKGPVALLFGLVPMLALGPDLRTSRALGCLAAGFVPVAAPWFAWLLAAHGTAPLAHFFWRENLARFATDVYASHRGPLYYVGVYLSLGAPWSLLLPLGLRGLAAQHVARRVALAVLVALVPLSLSRGKIEYYLLPLYPWLALLVARGLSAEWDRAARVASRVACALAGLGALALCALALRLPAPWALAPAAAGSLVAVSIFAAVALATAAWRPSPAWVRAVIAGAVALVGPVLVVTFLAATWELRPQARLVAPILEALRREPGTPVVVCHDAAQVERVLLFEHRVAVRHECDPAAVSGALPVPLLVLHDDDLARFAAATPLVVLAREPFLPAKAFQRALRGEAVVPRFVVLARPAPAHE